MVACFNIALVRCCAHAHPRVCVGGWVRGVGGSNEDFLKRKWINHQHRAHVSVLHDEITKCKVQLSRLDSGRCAVQRSGKEVYALYSRIGGLEYNEHS